MRPHEQEEPERHAVSITSAGVRFWFERFHPESDVVMVLTDDGVPGRRRRIAHVEPGVPPTVGRDVPGEAENTILAAIAAAQPRTDP